jgi:hypothetical protein
MECWVCGRKFLAPPVGMLATRFRQGQATIKMGVVVPGDKESGLKSFNPICDLCSKRALHAASAHFIRNRKEKE